MSATDGMRTILDFTDMVLPTTRQIASSRDFCACSARYLSMSPTT